MASPWGWAVCLGSLPLGKKARAGHPPPRTPHSSLVQPLDIQVSRTSPRDGRLSFPLPPPTSPTPPVLRFLLPSLCLPHSAPALAPSPLHAAWAPAPHCLPPVRPPHPFQITALFIPLTSQEPPARPTSLEPITSWEEKSLPWPLTRDPRSSRLAPIRQPIQT